MKKNINSSSVLLISTIVLLIAAALAVVGLMGNVMTQPEPYMINDIPVEYTSANISYVCGEYALPDEVIYEKKEEYATPYGSFEPIKKVFDTNEYMVVNTTALCPEDCLMYVTIDGTEENCDITMRKVKNLSREICRGIDNEYEKVNAIAMWVGTNVAYDFDAAEKSGSDPAVIALEAIFENNFRTTCAGFSNLFSALCHEQGIYCINLKGGSAAEGWTRSQLEEIPANHEWNGVIINGQWYFSDPTWISDLSYIDGEISGGKSFKPFYSITEFGEMSVEHRIDRSEHRCFSYK